MRGKLASALQHAATDSELAAEQKRLERADAKERREADLARKRDELYAWNAALRDQFLAQSSQAADQAV